MQGDKSEYRKWLIRDIKKIHKQLSENCKAWYELKYSTPDCTMAQAYSLVDMAIYNLINHYDPEFIIRDLLQQELDQRIQARFKKG